MLGIGKVLQPFREGKNRFRVKEEKSEWQYRQLEDSRALTSEFTGEISFGLELSRLSKYHWKLRTDKADIRHARVQQVYLA